MWRKLCGAYTAPAKNAETENWPHKRLKMPLLSAYSVLRFYRLPYVVAHWQIGALLAEIGAPLKKNERAAVYLTNSLTDWNEDKQIKLSIKGLEEEYQAANEIKREKPILVILGNPPYNAFAGLSPEEEEGLVAPYKEGLIKKWNIKKFNLDDLYVRFFSYG